MTLGKTRVLVAATLVAVGVLAIGGVAAAGTMLEATLTGAAEVPGPGDSNGTGEATLNLMPRQERICYTLTVSNIRPATMAHIHKGTATEAGPIVKGLMPPSDGSSEGCVRLDRTKIRMIQNNPAGYYVNVHNKPFPNGAVRGQLSPAGM
jgi:hypothetical protein